MGPQGPAGPKPPTLISPVSVESTVALTISNVTPLQPATMVDLAGKFELIGFSGYELTPAGATPLIVLRRRANADSSYFMARVLDQAPLGTVTLSFFTTTSAHLTLTEELQLENATVEAVATGWLEETIALRYTALREVYPNNGGNTALVPPNPNESVAPDLSLPPPDCGTCSGFFHGPQNGGTTFSGYLGWSDALQWSVVLAHTSSGATLRARAELSRDVSNNNVLKTLAAQAPMNRFDLHYVRAPPSQPTQVLTRIECTNATLDTGRRGPFGSMELTATLHQCQLAWRRIDQNGQPTGTPVTLTIP